MLHVCNIFDSWYRRCVDIILGDKSGHTNGYFLIHMTSHTHVHLFSTNSYHFFFDRSMTNVYIISPIWTWFYNIDFIHVINKDILNTSRHRAIQCERGQFNQCHRCAIPIHPLPTYYNTKFCDVIHLWISWMSRIGYILNFVELNKKRRFIYLEQKSNGVIGASV